MCVGASAGRRNGRPCSRNDKHRIRQEAKFEKATGTQETVASDESYGTRTYGGKFVNQEGYFVTPRSRRGRRHGWQGCCYWVVGTLERGPLELKDAPGSTYEAVRVCLRSARRTRRQLLAKKHDTRSSAWPSFERLPATGENLKKQGARDRFKYTFACWTTTTKRKDFRSTSTNRF